MIAVEFGKDRYHLQEEMIKWCRTTLGKGGWAANLELSDNNWSVDSMFGNTFFKFKESKDAVLFQLRWA